VDSVTYNAGTNTLQVRIDATSNRTESAYAAATNAQQRVSVVETSKVGYAMSASIVPAVSNAYDIGSSSFPIRDLYLGSNSMYMGGTRVLSYDPFSTSLQARVNLTLPATVVPAVPVGSSWTRATAGASWAGRYKPGGAAFNGQMWLMGGSGVSMGKSDVWRSTNGVTWVSANDYAEWTQRSEFDVGVFNGQMWMVGGYEEGVGAPLNEVWASGGGTNWVKTSGAGAPWAARYAHRVLTYDNKLWIMAGRGALEYVDVWHTSDGTNWTQATASAGWSARLGPGAAVFNGQMWLMGGAGPMGGAYNDVWHSADGAAWAQAGTASWSARQGMSVFVTNGMMYVIGGKNEDLVKLNDVWSTPDGTNWTQVAASSGWSVRYHSIAVSLNNRLWIYGGDNDGTAFNDVWSSIGVDGSVAASAFNMGGNIVPTYSNQFNLGSAAAPFGTAYFLKIKPPPTSTNGFTAANDLGAIWSSNGVLCVWNNP
jgi:hypothetical protein